MHMHALCYKSRSLIDKKYIAKELDYIHNIARERNLTDGISGVLFYKDACFLQIIEGKKDKLNALMDDIQKDPRHQDIEYIFDKGCEDRAFTGWSMQCFNFDRVEKMAFPSLRKVSDDLRKNDYLHYRDVLNFYNALLA